MKILLFVPTYKKADGTLAIHPDSLASIEALEVGDHDVTYCLSVDEHENKANNVLAQYRNARARAIREGFDALLTAEHDMILPPDALVKLAEVEAGVVYGVYLFRHGKPMLNAFRVTTGLYADQSLAMFPEELKKAQAAGIWPVSGLGMGCTLIRREVLERFEFRAPRDGHYPDGPLADDCCRAGIKQMARFDVQCGHIRPDGFVLWPRLESGGWGVEGIKVRFWEDVNVVILGQLKTYRRDEEAYIPLDNVGDLVRAGFCRVLEDPPDNGGVKVVTKPPKGHRGVKTVRDLK